MAIAIFLVISMLLQSVGSAGKNEPFKLALHGDLIGAKRPEIFISFADGEGVDVEVACVLTRERSTQAGLGLVAGLQEMHGGKFGEGYGDSERMLRVGIVMVNFPVEKSSEGS